jgi:cyanophycinase-like exopeptidase
MGSIDRRHRGIRQGLHEANAVWFNGKRQWNIVDSYANTLTLREFHQVLERAA